MTTKGIYVDYDETEPPQPDGFERDENGNIFIRLGGDVDDIADSDNSDEDDPYVPLFLKKQGESYLPDTLFIKRERSCFILMNKQFELYYMGYITGLSQELTFSRRHSIFLERYESLLTEYKKIPIDEEIYYYQIDDNGRIYVLTENGVYRSENYSMVKITEHYKIRSIEDLMYRPFYIMDGEVKVVDNKFL